MTHSTATRNIEARVARPNAQRLTRLVGLMSRYWVDPDLAAEGVEERRLAISKAYLVNHLGLVMLIEDRVKDGLRPVQIHHLPRQSPEVIRQALSLLTPHEVHAGLAAALKALTEMHPFAGGDVPGKPGWTREEAAALGIVATKRTADGQSLKMTCLAMISERWMSNREWEQATRSTRVAEFIRALREDGYDISKEDRPSDSGNKMPYTAYRYFVDPGERDAWKQEQAVKEYMKTRAQADEAARSEVAAKALRDKRILEAAGRRRGYGALASTPHSGGSKYGGWVRPAVPPAVARATPAVRQLFVAPAQPAVPSRPPANAMARLGALQGHRPQRIEVDSAPAVPAAALNRAFPGAGSNEVVKLGGLDYIRKFRPRKDGEKVVAWETFWERA